MGDLLHLFSVEYNMQDVFVFGKQYAGLLTPIFTRVYNVEHLRHLFSLGSIIKILFLRVQGCPGQDLTGIQSSRIQEFGSLDNITYI